MKILVITQYFYPENFRVNDLCIELFKRGHEVTVLTGYPQYPKGKIYDGFGFNIPYEKEWNGIRIERVKMKPRGKTPIGLLNNCYSFVKEANKWVKKCQEKFDAVYVFEVSPVTVGLPAITYKNKFGTPVIFNVQDLWPENVEVVLGITFKPIISIINRIVDKIYKNSDYILCSSKSFVKNIALRGVNEEKLFFWPQFCNMPDTDKMKKPDEYSDEDFKVAFTGNIGVAQGLDLLVEAANKMKNEKIKWYLVGDGRARDALQKKVLELGLEKTVIFTGRVSEQEANAYIHFADCAYLSFLDNKLFDMTIPAKLQSYLACEAPILAAVDGESKEILLEAECGVISHRDADGLCAAVKEMMNKKSIETERMRNNSKDYFEENFSKETVLRDFDEILEKIKAPENAEIAK